MLTARYHESTKSFAMSTRKETKHRPDPSETNFYADLIEDIGGWSQGKEVGYESTALR